MKKVIKFFKELIKKPYGKGAIFFGFYLIFFIVILLIINLGGTTIDDEYVNTGVINFKYLSKYNYSFDYKVVVDNDIYNYSCAKDNNTLKYIYNDKKYYTINNKSYAVDDESKEIENPIKFNKFLDENVLNEITKYFYVESKTTYDNGNTDYNLLISSNILNKIIDNNETDYEEVPNKVKITMNSNMIVKEIDYSLDSYCINKDNCKKLNIVISYKEFAERS